MNTFNLHPWIIDILNNNNIKQWTPIQEQSLKLFNCKKNIVGISPTGTGKTLAYVLPILQSLDLNAKKYQAIIVCPTRELARQVNSVLQMFKTKDNNLKISLWIGGIDINKLINEAKTNSGHIIICTPQRFLEVSKELPNSIFSNVKTFVLDEADMLMDLNFYPQIHQIIAKLPFENIYKIAMSATLHDVLNHELKNIYHNVEIINLNHLDLLMNKIEHYLVKDIDKNHALATILNQVNPYFCLIFTNTTKKADEIYKQLLMQNRNVINLHSKLSTRARKNNYKDIKQQKFQYVVASDLFSRGMDIDVASHVISYDLPDNPDWYLHRAGRVGRSRYTGHSYVLYHPQDQAKLEKILKKNIQFKTKQIKNNELVDAKINLKPYKPINEAQEQEIKKLIHTNKNNIKPGYKKKLKQEISKIKQKHKRAHIENLVKKQRLAKYRNQDKNN